MPRDLSAGRSATAGSFMEPDAVYAHGTIRVPDPPGRRSTSLTTESPMLVAIANTASDTANGTDGVAAIRIVLLLVALFGGCMWWYRKSTGDSRRLSLEIAQRGIDNPASLVPPPVTFGDREAAVAEGVDLAPLTARDPRCTALEMLSIGRETFTLVRKARAERIARLADGLLTAELRARLDDVVAADEQAQRHHMFPMLDIATSSVVGCAVDDTGEEVVIRYSLTGTEVERSDLTGEVVSGDEVAMQWEELWTYRRASGSTSAADAAEIDRLKTHTAGGWLIPHLGWTVSAVVIGDRTMSHVADPAVKPAVDDGAGVALDAASQVVEPTPPTS